MRHFWVTMMLVVAVIVQRAGTVQAAPVTIGVECEDFQFAGDWSIVYSPKGFSGRGALSNPNGAKLPALTAVQIPQAGRYALWVRAADFPDQKPGTRLFKVSVDGQLTDATFGKSGNAGFSWERGGEFSLEAGPVLLGIHDIGKYFARADAILLTSDLKFVPTTPLGRTRHPLVKPVELPVPSEADPFHAATISEPGGTSVATLENELLRVEWLPAQRSGRATVIPRVFVRQTGQWIDAGADANAETYAVVACNGVQLQYPGYFPAWRGGTARNFTIKLGHAAFETTTGGGMAIWDAGKAMRCEPRAVTTANGKVRIAFHPTELGELVATWELRRGEHTARVALEFTPANGGEFALGYQLCWRKPLANVDELLLPMMWQRKRFPSRPVTLLQPFTPTPVALAQSGPTVWGVCGAPEEIPFAWPDRRDPRFGLVLRSVGGEVQPAIFGPVPGTPRAKRNAGEPQRFEFRVLAQAGDWYAGYRTAADEVFALKDYRRNVGTSLTDAALNMIDLVLDDNFGGWWDRAKGPYQIETLNGATHASPLTPLSLYWLTGNEEVYQRRAVPTMEFVLSRNLPHFSPEPDNTGTSYPAGNLAGPVQIYGTTTFGGFWELTQRRTAAFRDVALPADTVRPTHGYGHGELFEEWLARHLLTGEPAALAKARELADEYLQKHITTPTERELSPEPFFNVSFVPDWEGLLRMFEVTGEKKYLDGAAFGARQLMTSVWTQPTIPTDDVTVYPHGEAPVSSPDHVWWKGPDKFRLGFPRRAGDTPEHRVPAWVPSNVGLGFEQPVTYNRRDTGGAMIYQSAWAANFLRLAAYTGDAAFETYARNAVLGRWANYPAYYVVGFTDAPLNPRYPYVGPDLGCIYYHHILPHLAWTIDFLVAEATLRSGGKISFPSQRQHGYVWFDSREFGAAPGKVYDTDGAWLWFDRHVVKLDNPAINYLLAHTPNRLCVVLLNENSSAENISVDFLAGKMAISSPQLTTSPKTPVKFANNRAELTIPARGLVVLTLDGVKIDVAAHQLAAVPTPGPNPGTATLTTGVTNVEIRAAAIQARPGTWDAFVWCTGLPKQVREVTFEYQMNCDWQKVRAAEYPFELSVTVPDVTLPFRFRARGLTSAGKPFTTQEAVIGATR